MNEIMCRYPGDREQVIVAYVYGEIDGEEREQFDAHLATCARCRTELSAFSEVRGQLSRWSEPPLEPPIPGLQSSISNLQFPWWQRVPAWAQVAAAMLFFGVAAGIANLDVRYDASGFHFRTGWLSQPAAVATVAPSPGDMPTRAELTAFEERLKAELVRPADTVGGGADSGSSTAGGASAAGNADLMRRVRALVDESERRQQRELALRVGELVRDVNAQRQADLVRIDRSLGVLQNSTGVEMMRQRETLNNILVRTSLQK
jgi:anti-sigma factor RsiW